jgi:hypothetical protein
MKTDRRSRLLDAVLTEDADFREATLRQTRRLARRRRRVRLFRRGAGIGALAVAAILGLRFALPDAGRPQSAAVEPLEGVKTIHSEPLAARQILATRPAQFSTVGSFAKLAVIGTRPLDIRITKTDLARPEVGFLDDRQLLAVFAGERAALIDPGTERARLIFY